MAGRELVGAGDVRRDRAPRPLPHSRSRRCLGTAGKKQKQKNEETGAQHKRLCHKGRVGFPGGQEGGRSGHGTQGTGQPPGTASGESIGAQALEALVRCHGRTGPRVWRQVLGTRVVTRAPRWPGWEGASQTVVQGGRRLCSSQRTLFTRHSSLCIHTPRRASRVP